MLSLSDLHYAVAARLLFEGANARIPPGHKVGLVGRNGTGKTTLFRLIRGELSAMSGQISLPARARIGGVAQEVPSSQTSLLDTVLAADTERSALMGEHSDDPARVAEIQTRLSDIGAWSAPARAARILKGLGFDEADQQRPCSDFSGGWRMRVALAAVLFSAPDLLLLDEPTNYLDLEGTIWLEAYLARYPHTVLIISHDRGLLNRAVGSILHLEDRKLTLYQGPYDQFARQRAAKLAQADAMAKKQQARRAHLQSYVDRFRYKADKARQAQSRLKALAKMQPITSPSEAGLRQFDFPQPDALPAPIIQLEAACAGYGEHEVLGQLSLRIDQDDRIALLGKNGQGKSTFSKLLAQKLMPMSGVMRRARGLRVGYFAQHQVDELNLQDTPLAHLRTALPGQDEKALRARLAGFGLHADQATVPVGALSGGQKARLSLLLATLDAPHLLILDEPTNHLDIESREALIEALTAYEGAVVLVSHDMHLLELVADRLWLVEAGTVRPYEQDLQAYRGALLQGDKTPADAKAPDASVKARKAPKTVKADLTALRSALRKSEARIEKLNQMHEALSARLADPALYDDQMRAQRLRLQEKYAELSEAMELAEKIWLNDAQALEDGER